MCQSFVFEILDIYNYKEYVKGISEVMTKFC